MVIKGANCPKILGPAWTVGGLQSLREAPQDAERVQAAWGAVRELQAAPFWQQQLQTWLRFDLGPEEDLKHVIQQALEDARSRGRDYVGQTELAVRAVTQVRPDMNASDALAAVRLFRQS